MSVAETAIATFSDNSFLLISCQIGQKDRFGRPILRECNLLYYSADWHFDNKIFAGATSATLSGTIFAVFCG
jgi:hypothetical protein